MPRNCDASLAAFQLFCVISVLDVSVGTHLDSNVGELNPSLEGCR